ncbi:MAG: 2-oxo acid dehydrogenase subunit E2 [Thermoleophilia bacterium]|nr:2-oxo acid dehydrogenase subunit E2 [Thermoleophilia bacterium]
MPRLSDAMTEGLIVRWIKAPGEALAEGDELVEIETDKATMVYEADRPGVLTEILAGAGETVSVGTAIARIDGEGAEVVTQVPSGGTAPPVEPAAPGAGESAAAVPAPVRGPEAPSGRVKASPVARRLAERAGIDIATVSGSGPGGRISKRDVEALLATVPSSGAGTAPAPSAAEATAEVRELSRLQALAAQRVTEAKATAPHFYLETSVDVTELSAGLSRMKERRAAGDDRRAPSVNDAIIKACAIALRRHPKVNGAYREGRWEIYPEVNVGFAVAAGEDLLVPVVRAADRGGLSELAARSRELAAAARDGSLAPGDMEGGTFTISNLGMLGVESFQAVINGGQAAILAVGAIVPSVVPGPDGESVVARQVMRVVLSCDHRILTGAEGAEFLQTLRGVLEEPLSFSE